MVKQRSWLLAAIAISMAAFLIFFPFQATLAQFPPTTSYDWKPLKAKITSADCPKMAKASVSKLFSDRFQERKSGTCGQGRGFAGCVVCLPEQEVAVGIATGFDGVQTEVIVKQLLSGF